jgi:hypothetical protein
MNELFDRYFLILAGRIASGECGSAASRVPAGSVGGSCSFGWPLDLPEDSEQENPGVIDAVQPKTEPDAQ